MRIVVAERRGNRGEGLGNECFAWAKGWIASQVLNARLIGPSWGINKRRYYRNFGTSRFDVVLEELFRRLPHHRFTEADYVEIGEIDFGRSIAIWAARRGLTPSSHFVLTVSGMYGGYPAIYSARSFLLAKFMNSRQALRNMYQIASRLDRAKLSVAVHMRFGGDFAPSDSGEDIRGKFNIKVPDAWYLWVCEKLQESFAGKIQFHFFTDRGGPGFEEAVRRFNPEQTRQTGLTECSDLLLMAQADLRVCSISSYSLVANYLSGGPYIWYEPQLNLEDGLYALWSHERTQQTEASPSQQARAFFLRDASAPDSAGNADPLCLGVPLAVGDALPQSLLSLLSDKLRTLDPRSNLIDYGCTPKSREGQSS